MTCTWGEAGAWALEADGRMHHCPAFPPPKVVDTVGAGDVFNAGMIHGLATGADTAQALETATRLAGRKVGLTGFSGLALKNGTPGAPHSKGR
jgi:ketohexokinase